MRDIDAIRYSFNEAANQTTTMASHAWLVIARVKALSNEVAELRIQNEKLRLELNKALGTVASARESLRD
jgi:hypothetical protein